MLQWRELDVSEAEGSGAELMNNVKRFLYGRAFKNLSTTLNIDDSLKTLNLNLKTL